jgi:processive 1,2-diacylglycerol beta-glucosyltransferase
VPNRAIILSGSLGSGHDAIAEAVTASLARLGWESRTLDCMRLLGRRAGQAGDWVFRRLTAMPGVYDGLHFAHFRSGSPLAQAMDEAATSRLVPALRAELRREPADLLIAVFATGASAAAKLALGGAAGLELAERGAAGPEPAERGAAGPEPAERGAAGPEPAEPGRGCRRVVLCIDAVPHSLWVRDGIDLFLVTSAAAAASVRRYVPRAQVRVVPPPVRSAFYSRVPQAAARQPFGIPAYAGCVLLMGGGWGLGPLEQSARALADAGVHVLAVAGRNRQLAARLEALARSSPRVHPFGFTERIVELMNASDVVVTLPGAMTCAEARAVGRRLVLLDAMPGHGRENVQHQLELGGADVCNPRPEDLTASVLAALNQARRRLPSGGRMAGEWDQAFAAALASIDLELPGDHLSALARQEAHCR